MGYHRGYELHSPDGRKYPGADWDWAEWDRHRLVWAAGGCIRAALLGGNALEGAQVLYDFRVTESDLGIPRSSTELKLMVSRGQASFLKGRRPFRISGGVGLQRGCYGARVPFNDA